MARGQRRIRTIKPEFCESVTMSRLSIGARLTFVLLWTLVDDDGRSRGGDVYLAHSLYPNEAGMVGQCSEWIAELAAAECVVTYDHDGAPYIAVRNWSKHQKINRRSPSQLPEPPCAFTECSVNGHGAVSDDATPLPRPTTYDQLSTTTTADESAWADLLDAIGETYGGIVTRKGNGAPLAWAGRIVGVAGKHAADDPDAALRLWRSWVASIDDVRYMPATSKAFERFGAWLASRNGKAARPWVADGYDDA
jgi:hypothetical protein